MTTPPTRPVFAATIKSVQSPPRPDRISTVSRVGQPVFVAPPCHERDESPSGVSVSQVSGVPQDRDCTAAPPGAPPDRAAALVALGAEGFGAVGFHSADWVGGAAAHGEAEDVEGELAIDLDRGEDVGLAWGAAWGRVRGW
jgi:hypothetical protein